MTDGESTTTARSKDGDTSIGVAPELLAAVAYPLAPLAGLVLFVIEDESEFVRFHALQSLLLGAVSIPPIVFSFFFVIGAFLAVLYAITVCVMAYKAYNGEQYELPVIGGFAASRVEAVRIEDA